MSPATARAMYRRQIDAHGSAVTVRRVNASPAAPTDAAVTAWVVGYQPEELVGGIQQGDRKVIVLAEDLEEAAWPEPVKRNDKVILASGEVLNVEVVDDQTRRIAGELIAYEITARG